MTTQPSISIPSWSAEDFCREDWTYTLCLDVTGRVYHSESIPNSGRERYCDDVLVIPPLTHGPGLELWLEHPEQQRALRTIVACGAAETDARDERCRALSEALLLAVRDGDIGRRLSFDVWMKRHGGPGSIHDLAELVLDGDHSMTWKLFGRERAKLLDAVARKVEAVDVSRGDCVGHGFDLADHITDILRGLKTIAGYRAMFLLGEIDCDDYLDLTEDL